MSILVIANYPDSNKNPKNVSYVTISINLNVSVTDLQYPKSPKIVFEGCRIYSNLSLLI